MTASAGLQAGFDDYGARSNDVFRACLAALSRPCTVQPLDAGISAPSPLLPAMAAVAMTLADFETSIWLDPVLAAEPEVDEYLRFHTGARRTDAVSEADFALIGDASSMPGLQEFKQGTPEYPDRSTTLIIAVEELADRGMTFEGPGIDGSIAFAFHPMPAGFASQLRDNRCQFPCGVDMIFVTRTHIAALPRSAVLKSEG